MKHGKVYTPACLPDRGADFTGETAWVYGWGTTEMGGYLADTLRFGLVWYGMVWYGMVWYGMVWYGMVWYGMVWYCLVWHGMALYGMIWYSMVLYGHPSFT